MDMSPEEIKQTDGYMLPHVIPDFQRLDMNMKNIGIEWLSSHREHYSVT